MDQSNPHRVTILVKKTLTLKDEQAVKFLSGDGRTCFSDLPCSSHLDR